MKHPNAIVQRYIEVANDFYTEFHKTNPRNEYNAKMGNCLNATRVTLDVMRHFNIKATALSVRFYAYNHAWMERVRIEGRLPSGDAEANEWVLKYGAWALGVDTVDRGEEHAYPGHVVAIVQGHIIDASVGQFSRPQRGIPFPEVIAVPTFPRFFKKKEATRMMDPATGACAMWFSRDEDRQYERESGFQPHARNREIVEELVMRVRGERKIVMTNERPFEVMKR